MAAFDFPASPVNGQQYTANGVTYVWSAADTAWKGQGSSTPLSNSQRVFYYTLPQTVAYVKPAGLKALQVELWGPGGGGGGAGATTATTMAAGGGGGGGGYTRKLYQASELAASESLVIGAGGAAGTSVANGGTGTATTFKGQTAPSGTGGAVNAASSAIGGTSGRGITNIGTGGDYNSGGTSGQPGVKFYSGSTNTALPGYGGPGWGGALTFPTPTTTQNSQAGTKSPAGGGGNGSANAFSQAAVDAGAGGDGMAIFTEYYTENDVVPGGNFLQEVVTTWQPQLQFGNANVGMTMAARYGNVVKQGSLVTASFDFSLSAKGTSVGGARITNLPYPIEAVTGGGNTAGTIGYVNLMAAGANQLGCYISTATPSELIITKTTSGGAGTANTADTDFTNSTRLIGSITYRTAA